VKHVQFLRKYRRGQPLAKLHGYVKPPRGDHSTPLARIERIRRAKPDFVPNREGWGRFYRWQDWHGRHLDLKSRLNGWR
jgi:hypothetical protein